MCSFSSFSLETRFLFAPDSCRLVESWQFCGTLLRIERSHLLHSNTSLKVEKVLRDKHPAATPGPFARPDRPHPHHPFSSFLFCVSKTSSSHNPLLQHRATQHAGSPLFFFSVLPRLCAFTVNIPTRLKPGAHLLFFQLWSPQQHTTFSSISIPQGRILQANQPIAPDSDILDSSTITRFRASKT